MTFIQDGNSYIVVLKKGQKIVESIQAFAARQSIQAAWIGGLGAVLKAEIGYYSLAKKDYHFVQLDSILEIVSLSGNISYFEDKPILHAHIVLSDEGMKTYGGHLKEATVGGTCEIHIQALNKPLKRQLDGETGLKLLSL